MDDYLKVVRTEDPKPFGFSGCFRLRNEAQFMKVAIQSHMAWLDEAVLVVQPSTDNTYHTALDMAREDPRIKVYTYPFVPDWIDTPGFYAKDPDEPGHLVHMSNWALSKCTYSWIVKVEGDVVALPSFDNIIKVIVQHPDTFHYYGRIILNLAGFDLDKISMENPRNGGWDECVIPNHPTYKFKRINKWEVLENPAGMPSTCMGLSALHLKRCKEGKSESWNNETYLPLEDAFRVWDTFNDVHGYLYGDGHEDLYNNWNEILDTIGQLKHLMFLDE